MRYLDPEDFDGIEDLDTEESEDAGEEEARTDVFHFPRAAVPGGKSGKKLSDFRGRKRNGAQGRRAEIGRYQAFAAR
jgi:hypothetical protein